MSIDLFILGAAGFLGRGLAEAFAGRGHRVTAATRHPASFSARGVTNVVAEFAQPADFTPWMRAGTLVIDAASSSTPASTATQPLIEIDSNLRRTASLLTAMQASNCSRLLALSSGGTLYGDCATGATREESVLLPRSYHGAGKAAAEHFIQAWATHEARKAILLRPSNVYGVGQVPRAGFGIVPAAMSRARLFEPLSIWGDGSAVRDYLYVEDFIELCVRLVERDWPEGALRLNAARGVGTTTTALLDVIDAVTQTPLQRIHHPKRPTDVDRIVPDPGAAECFAGWRWRTDLREGVERTWRWFNTTQ